jgi:iron complex outermembrane receptor protein
MALPAAALAQSAAGEPAVRLAPVVVTATRTEVLAFDVPASIDRVGSETIREGKPQINISESLGGVPGLVARDRQNYAQDVQLSIRGFGARSTFGIRGVRLYVDGIPATLPDVQGRSPTWTSARPTGSRSCAGRSRRSTATRRAA